MEGYGENCMICGEGLVYFEAARKLSCHTCGKEAMTNACCEQGHFICDACHGEAGFLLISRYAGEGSSRNPMEIATEMMKNPGIPMHGPEHHYLVAASLLAAYANAGGRADRSKALHRILERARNVPGGICGMWGSCGAGISTGIFWSVITGATPLSQKEWSQANGLTAKSLARIAAHGGPRCCKRNSYLAIMQGAAAIEEQLGVSLELPREIACEFSRRNQECKKAACLFYANEI